MTDNPTEISKTLNPREIPKVGGSAAGFIVLVVLLCLIIMVSLIAIILLLWSDNTSDEEKNQRPKSSTYVTPLEDEDGSRPSSWLRRTYGRLPFVHTANITRVPSIRVPRPSSRQEAFAPSREEHAESRDEVYLDVPQMRRMNRHPQLGLHPSISTIPSIRRLSTPTTSSCSVRFETSGMREIFPYERDRFAPSPTATLPNIHTQMSSPSSTPASSPITGSRRPRIISQEVPSLVLPTPVRYEQESAQYSTVSPSPSPVPPTFEGGTKFLETF